MDWSSVFPGKKLIFSFFPRPLSNCKHILALLELLLTSYDKNVDSVHDPDGICLVWNTRYKKTTPGKVTQSNHIVNETGKKTIKVVNSKTNQLRIGNAFIC